MSEGSPLARLGRQARAWLQSLGRSSARDGESPALGLPAVGEMPQVSPTPALPDLSDLEKQIAKVGREQFKLNTLAEAQRKQVEIALQQLREQADRRERDFAELLARRQAKARLEVIQRLLPVLDGLEEALSTGERLLERAPSLVQVQELGKQLEKQDNSLPPLVTLFAWPAILLGLIFPRLMRRPGYKQRRRAIASLAASVAAWEDSYLAWLRGLELVHSRLLETLAVEGVEPVESVGRPFDPHLHVALETVPAGPEAPAGTIVSELRRGYVTNSRVLRYAEVVVAREMGSVTNLRPTE